MSDALGEHTATRSAAIRRYALARLYEGPATTSEIVAALPFYEPRRLVHYALCRLERAKLVSRAPATEPGQPDTWSTA